MGHRDSLIAFANDRVTITTGQPGECGYMKTRARNNVADLANQVALCHSAYREAAGEIERLRGRMFDAYYALAKLGANAIRGVCLATGQDAAQLIDRTWFQYLQIAGEAAYGPDAVVDLDDIRRRWGLTEDVIPSATSPAKP